VVVPTQARGAGDALLQSSQTPYLGDRWVALLLILLAMVSNLRARRR